MSEIPAIGFPKKSTPADEQHAIELVNIAIDEAQVENHDNECASDLVTDVEAEAGDTNTAPEETYIAVELKDMPAILDNLESDVVDTWNESLNKLAAMIYQQQEFIAENLTAFEIPRMIKVAQTTTHETLCSSILEFVTGLPLNLGTTRKTAVTYIPDLVPFLANGNVLDRQNVLSILEQLAEDEPSSHELIFQCAKSMYEPMRNFEPQTEVDELKLIALIESFENAYLYGREHIRKIFVQAFAIDVILTSMLVEKPFYKVRLAAQSCLTQIIEYNEEVNENVPDEDDQGLIVPYIVSAFLHQVTDENKEVADAATQFITSDNEAINQLVLAQVVDSPNVAISLILQFAEKAANTVGAPCDYALIKILENDDANKSVVDAFHMIWQDEDILSEIKFAIIDRLIYCFTPIRAAALKGDLCEFIIKASKEEKTAIKAMTLLDRLMDTDQTVDVALLKIEGAIANFLDLLEGPVSEMRCLAAAVLARTLDSCIDSKSQRPLATAALSGDNSYPRVLAALHSDDPKTVNAVAKLLAEILADEEGSKSWSYEEESGGPPPACPLKDRTVTPELAAYTIALLKQPDVAASALALLCQFCWGYQRGFDIVSEAFESVVPDADAFFFSALDGNFVSRHVGRQRRVVADAAVKAGGLARAAVLLEEEHASPEARQAAVEGYRLMLCADSVDPVVGRENPKLPGILATLFAEGSLESLKTVNFMIRLVSAEDFTKTIPAWKDFATPKTVEQLVRWINTFPRTFESPNAEGLTDEEFSRLDKECYENTAKSREDCDMIHGIVSEIITNVIPILVPYSSQLWGPLLHCTDTNDDQDSKLLKALSELATAAEAGGHIGDAVVLSIKELMAKDPPPSVLNCHTWITLGPGLATALFLGGLLDRLFKVYDIEGDDQFHNTDFHMPLQVIEALIRNLSDKDHARAVQKAFWENEKAVGRALGYIRDKEDIYTAWQVSGELYTFSYGYPEGIARLEKENIYPNILDIFDNPELDRPSDVGPLIGQFCHVDVEKLTALLRSHVSGLKPPAEDIFSGQPPDPGKKKGKKGKKTKKFEPKITLAQVLERFASLVDTTPQARKALFEAQALEVAKDALSTDDVDARTYAFKVLQGFVATSDKVYVDVVVDALPQLAMAYKKAKEPLAANLELLRILMVEHLPRLIDADVPRMLVKALTDSPSEMDLLINTVLDIAKADGVKLLAQLFHEALEAEDAFVQELNWGNSHALRRLVDESELGASVVMEAGGLDYAFRLLQSEDLHHVVKGGALSATIARSKFLQVQNKLLELGIAKAVEEGHDRCVESSKKKFDAEHDGDEDEFREMVLTRQKWSKVLSAALVIVSGEIVQDYEEDFFL